MWRLGLSVFTRVCKLFCLLFCFSILLVDKSFTNILAKCTVHATDSTLHFCFTRFMSSESILVDTNKENRLKAIVTTEGVYFVPACETPSPEAIVHCVRFSDLDICECLSIGKYQDRVGEYWVSAYRAYRLFTN